ncbi:hypothetical protein P692DRAFT_20895803 [Suillus brevipes Sb2]|nr:hypothetical protein P692DRAFT_20895803 [Suillus brevipes Sb2]
MKQHITNRSEKWRLCLWYPHILRPRSSTELTFGHTTQIHQQSKHRQHTLHPRLLSCKD